jgi:hypothetical protein
VIDFGSILETTIQPPRIIPGTKSRLIPSHASARPTDATRLAMSRASAALTTCFMSVTRVPPGDRPDEAIQRGAVGEDVRPLRMVRVVVAGGDGDLARRAEFAPPSPIVSLPAPKSAVNQSSATIGSNSTRPKAPTGRRDPAHRCAPMSGAALGHDEDPHNCKSTTITPCEAMTGADTGVRKSRGLPVATVNRTKSSGV